jgi:hypothetical protein
MEEGGGRREERGERREERGGRREEGEEVALTHLVFHGLYSVLFCRLTFPTIRV